MSAESDKLAGALICLGSVVELLRAEGMQRAGEYEGLLAYQALTRIKGQAEAWGVPLADIGLDGFDVDSLLNPPRKAA